MTKKMIHVRAKPGQPTEVKAQGYQGTECQQATAGVRRSIGDDGDEELLPEFHQTSQETQQEQTEQQ